MQTSHWTYEFIGNHAHKLIQDIDNGRATEVKDAYFTQGAEDEIISRFYRLRGKVIRSVENRGNTSIRFFRVDGTNLDLFNDYYPI